MTARCPAILIAAPASGQGKTTVACALARLHTRQGRRVRVFKCGPDFLDPHWLALASGAPVHQLDLWMTGELDSTQRLHDAALEAELIIVEGVMGLFDGEPSAADLAQRFGLNVLAVIDASAMAGTFGALAFGLQHYRDGLRWAGVLANRVASAGHAEMLQNSLNEPEKWLGALLRNESMTLPERHLGLVMTDELDGSGVTALQRLDMAADALAATPLGQKSIHELKAWTVEFQQPLPEAFDAQRKTSVPIHQALYGRVIAVARDAAFCFIYPANIDILQSLGAGVVYFSPLADSYLPPCDALWLPGGYPELHAGQLAANACMKAAIRQHVGAGKPLWAECGGMMALFDELVSINGDSQRMWGVLPGKVEMQQRLAALGPQQLELASGVMRGHTFHYSTCASPLAPATRTQAAPGRKLRGLGEALYVFGPSGAAKASYFHAWFASNPLAAASLFLEPAHD